MLLTATIDAHKEHDVATIDVPNISVQTRLEQEEYSAVIRLWGKLANIIVKVAPEVYIN